MHPIWTWPYRSDHGVEDRFDASLARPAPGSHLRVTRGVARVLPDGRGGLAARLHRVAFSISLKLPNRDLLDARSLVLTSIADGSPIWFYWTLENSDRTTWVGGDVQPLVVGTHFSGAQVDNRTGAYLVLPHIDKMRWNFGRGGTGTASLTVEETDP